MAKIERRAVKLESLDDAVREMDRLLAAGYDKAGNWSLAQCCSHLSEWLRYPIEGYPKSALPIRMVFWVLRTTIGRKKLQAFLATGEMPAGTPTLPQSVPLAGGDDAAEVAKFRSAVERWKNHPGDYLPSPLFGKLSRDDATRLQWLHASHHLSFLVPKHG